MERKDWTGNSRGRRVRTSAPLRRPLPRPRKPSIQIRDWVGLVMGSCSDGNGWHSSLDWLARAGGSGARTQFSLVRGIVEILRGQAEGRAESGAGAGLATERGRLAFPWLIGHGWRRIAGLEFFFYFR